MFGRGLLVSAALLVVLAGLVFWSNKTKEQEEAKASAEPANKLVKVSDADITRIQITRQGEPPTVLERTPGKSWEMKAPQALRVDQEAADSLVSAFSGMTSDRVIEEKTADLSGFGLSVPAAQVTLTAKDGKNHSLLLGDESPAGGGVFAKTEGSPRVVTVPASTRDTLVKTYKDLRDKRLMTFEADKVNRLALTAKGQVMEFAKTGGNWTITKPRPMRPDGGQLEELVRKLGEARMDPAVTEEDAKLAASGFSASPRVAAITVSDASGVHSIEVRKSSKENTYYARGSAIEGVHKITEDLGKSVDKAPEEFRNKRLFDFGFNDPDRVEVQVAAGTRYSFAKSGEKWRAGGKDMDPVGVQSLIDKLRDLSSTRFVEYGFTAPSIELVVSSNGGKLVETVRIAKAGDRYIAKRGEEPSLYELDPKAAEELQRAASDVKPPPPPTAAPAKK